MNAKERLQMVLAETSNSLNSLGKAIGLKRSQLLYDIRDEKIKNISFQIATLISKKYEQYSVDWLMDGILSEKKVTLNTSNKFEEPYIGYQPNIPLNFMDQINALINSEKSSGIEVTPLYNRHITTDSVSQLVKQKIIPDVLLLNSSFSNCDLIIRHTDPAMTGYLSEKSYIGLKSIKKDRYLRMIIPGKLYVIVVNDYVIERFLHEGSTGKFLLKSFNKDLAPDFEIYKEDISELWLVKSWMLSPEIETV